MLGSGHTNPALKLVTFADLKERGVPYSRDHLRRMTVAGTFPKPIQLGPGRVAWVEAEIADWIEARIAARGAAQPQRRKLITAGRPFMRNSDSLPGSAAEPGYDVTTASLGLEDRKALLGEEGGQ